MRLFYTFMDPVNDVSSMSPWTLYMRSCRIDRKQKHSADVVLWKTENGGHMEAERSRLEVAEHRTKKTKNKSNQVTIPTKTKKRHAGTPQPWKM